MNIDLSKRYELAEDFFNLDGSVVMRLSSGAAIAVCENAAKRKQVVVRIEGGIWHDPGFEARLDCVWDGGDPPMSVSDAEKNNRLGADFVREERVEHDVFIITATPIDE